MSMVPDSGTILDLASGGNPFAKATILSDRYPDTTRHRRVGIVRDHRPFVILDIHALPFRDKSIDYIYCSHVVEHAEDPIRACSELMRAGKAGYIETPTRMKDLLFSWAGELGHRWSVVRFGNRLVFFEYDDRQKQGVRSTYWKDSVTGEFRHPNQDLIYPNADIFNTILEWKDRFEVTVFRHGASEPLHL